jgi:hypothetical protein
MSTERVMEVLLRALKDAQAQPEEQRLYRSGKLPGLFGSRNGPSGEAAVRALREGLLEVVRTEMKGKTVLDWVRLTPSGVEFIHDNESPLTILRELYASLRASSEAVPVWQAELRRHLHQLGERLAAEAAGWEQRLNALTQRVEETLRRLEATLPVVPPELERDFPWATDALLYLERRKTSDVRPCPLPELFEALQRQHPALALAPFHEGLRRLRERRSLQLLPANGEEVPQPEYSLLDNAQTCYYAMR